VATLGTRIKTLDSCCISIDKGENEKVLICYVDRIYHKARTNIVK
jgi:hypothetical protein